MSGLVVSGLTPFAFWLGVPLLGAVMITWVLTDLFCLSLLRMGFHLGARYIYFVMTCVMIMASSLLLGPVSYVWVFFLQFPAGSFFMTTPKEKTFRWFSFGASAFCLLLTVILYALQAVTPEIGPEHHTGMVYYGIFNVSYAAFVLLMSVLRYQQEVTDYKGRLEQQSISVLQQAKLSTLGEMAAGVAHEINNPLGIIIGKIEILEKRLGQSQVDSDKVIHDFGKIKQVVQRIARIVSSLRSYARNAENDPFIPSRLDDIVNETIQLCGANLTIHNINIRVTGDENIVFEARAVQISQVLVNLINNSFDAIQKLPEKWIEICLERVDDKRFTISVVDSGHGISKDVADKIMQPFFTTKETGKGSGLGLSVSKSLVEEHNGTLVFDRSSPRTKFVIELPLKHEELIQEELAAAA